MTPNYDEYTTPADISRALIYTSEYQMPSDAPSRMRSKHDQTPMCAVCEAPTTRSSALMIPARKGCPSSAWRFEYRGYLMAERWNHSGRTEYVCVDKDMQTEPGTNADVNGALFYLVEGRCLTGGGLPCGPYMHGWELTCVVCTK